MKTKINFKGNNFLKAFSLAGILILFVLSIQSCQTADDLSNDPSTMEYQATLNTTGDIYFERERFERLQGSPVTVTVPIFGNTDISRFGPDFTVYVENGDGTNHMVPNAVVKIDGQVIFSGQDFNHTTPLLSKEISGLARDSQLEITIYGSPGRYIELWIEGTIIIELPYLLAYSSGSYCSGKTYSYDKDGDHEEIYDKGGNLRSFSNKLYINSNLEYKMYILEYDGTQTQVIDLIPPFNVQYFNPLPNGRIAFYDFAQNKIYIINTSGDLIHTISTNLASQSFDFNGVVVGNSLYFPSDSNVYVVNLTTYEVNLFMDVNSAVHSLDYNNGVFYAYPSNSNGDSYLTFNTGLPITYVYTGGYAGGQLATDGQNVYVSPHSFLCDYYFIKFNIDENSLSYIHTSPVGSLDVLR